MTVTSPGSWHYSEMRLPCAQEDVIQSPPGVFGFGNGHLERELCPLRDR
jgi:hypothetical protein